MRKGFTLIELAIVLVISGIIIAMSLDGTSAVMEQNKVNETKAKLDTIEAALLSYYKTYGHLPCPARRAATLTSTTYGQASCVVAADLIEVPVKEVLSGVVPTSTLGLPKDAMFDGWSNRISYSVIRDLAEDDTSYSAYTGLNGTDGVIVIRDRHSHQITKQEDDPETIVAYVLVSHGKDGLGAYSASGAELDECTGTHDDVENCDNDAVFISSMPYDIEGDPDYYDDYTRYKLKEVLELEAE